MKALVKAKAERGIWMEDIDTPKVGHNDVLIKVNRTAICGTDIHIFKWDDWAQATIPVPMAVDPDGFVVELASHHSHGIRPVLVVHVDVRLPQGEPDPRQQQPVEHQ